MQTRKWVLTQLRGRVEASAEQREPSGLSLARRGLLKGKMLIWICRL